MPEDACLNIFLTKYKNVLTLKANRSAAISFFLKIRYSFVNYVLDHETAK